MCSSPDRAGLGLSLDRGIVLCFWARHFKSHSASPHPDLEIGTGGLLAGVTVRKQKNSYQSSPGFSLF